MTKTRRAAIALIGGAATLMTGAVPVLAQDAAAPPAPVTHDVQMLNKDPADPKQIMVFEPDLVIARPGDSIRFVPTDKGHFAASQAEVIPAGAEPYKGVMNKEETVTLTVEGAYAFVCTPHATMGMSLLVLVGDPSSNYEAVKAYKFRGKPLQTRMNDLFVRADAALAQPAANG